MTDHVAANARGLKVHLRIVGDYRVVTLRPATRVRFSTNFFHGTWHLLTGPAGALVLGRLMWGLAYQRQPGTVVLIDAPHLVPTPFEADPPDPILIVPAGLSRAGVEDLRTLRHRLRRVPRPTATIRWHTFGLPRALERPHDDKPLRDRMSRRGGFVCYTAPAALLRHHAAAIYADPGYLYLASERGCMWPDGEVQIVDDFDTAVAAATVARRELAVPPSRLASDGERVAVWDRKRGVERRMRDARRG